MLPDASSHDPIALDDGASTAADRIAAAAVAGTGWIFLGKVVIYTCGLLRLVVLARLLAPRDFGLMGAAFVALGAIETFTETGFEAALVQRRGDVRPYLDAAFTIRFLRGCLLAGAVWLAAPAVAALFEEPELQGVLWAASLVLIARGAANPAMLYWTRHLQFRKLFLWNLCETLLGLALAVTFAMAYRDVRALVVSAVGTQAVSSFFSHWLLPERPRLTCHLEPARELLRFGKWVAGSKIMMFLSLQGDSAFVGKMLGTASLGFYQVAFRISELPVTMFSQTVTQVTFPAFSRLQSDPARIRDWWVRVASLLFVVNGAVALGFVVLGDMLVTGILGASWRESIAVLRVLAVACFIRSLVVLSTPVLYALGRPHVHFWMNAARFAAMAVSIYPLSQAFGLVGVAQSVLLGIVATLPFGLGGVWRSLNALPTPAEKHTKTPSLTEAGGN